MRATVRAAPLRFPTESIHPEVLQILRLSPVSDKGNRASRKEKGLAGFVGYDLNDVFVGSFLGMNGAGRGDQIGFRASLKLFHQFPEQSRVDERFVALDIEEDRRPLQFFRDFSDPVGAARVFRRSQRDLGPKLERCLHNPHVVRSDDDPIKNVCFEAALPNVLDQGLAGDSVQRFTGEAGRPPACGDDGGDPAHELAVVIDARGKDKLGVG